MGGIRPDIVTVIKRVTFLAIVKLCSLSLLIYLIFFSILSCQLLIIPPPTYPRHQTPRGALTNTWQPQAFTRLIMFKYCQNSEGGPAWPNLSSRKSTFLLLPWQHQVSWAWEDLRVLLREFPNAFISQQVWYAGNQSPVAQWQVFISTGNDSNLFFFSCERIMNDQQMQSGTIPVSLDDCEH